MSRKKTHKNKDTVRKAGIYTRRSKEEADLKDVETAVEDQEAACRELIADRGWEVVDVYTDPNVSGYESRAHRKHWERMLTDIDSGVIDAVVAWRVDRLGRRVNALADMAERLHDRGGVLVTADRVIDTDGDFGKAQLHIMSALAQWESEQMGIRLSRKEERMAARGFPHMGSRRAYGFTDTVVTVVEADGTKGKLPERKVVPEEAEIGREAARRLLDHEKGAAIAADLIARGVKGTKGKPMRYQTLKQILENPSVAGYRTYYDTLHPGRWDPIVDPDDWKRLMRRWGWEFYERDGLLKYRKEDSPGKGKRAHGKPSLLAGLLVSSKSGEPMHARGNGVYAANVPGQDTTSIGADKLDRFVFMWLEPLIVGRQLVGDEKSLDELRAERRSVEAKKTTYAMQHYDGEIDDAEWDALRQRVRDDLAQLDARIGSFDAVVDSVVTPRPPPCGGTR